jgi:hypothetical protein
MQCRSLYLDVTAIVNAINYRASISYTVYYISLLHTLHTHARDTYI